MKTFYYRRVSEYASRNWESSKLEELRTTGCDAAHKALFLAAGAMGSGGRKFWSTHPQKRGRKRPAGRKVIFLRRRARRRLSRCSGNRRAGRSQSRSVREARRG